MTRMSFDVVIAGGGVIGSSIAYFLTRDSGLRVAVIEPDPTYEFAATPRSAGGIRSQFSTRTNVLMSQFGVEFVRQAGDLLEVDGDRPEIGFKEKGYLILVPPEGEATLRRNHAVQTGCGARITLLDPDALARRFPWLNPEGVALGSFGESGEGWLDPYSLLQAFRRKARAQGATCLTDRVTGLGRDGGRIASVALQSGAVLECGTFVNAAGINGAEVAAMAGIADLPVEPRKRQIFVFSCRERIADMPLLIDTSGIYCRTENDLFICSVAPDANDDPACTDFGIDHGRFESDIWPVLAARVPRFEAIRPVNAWAGHYDVNTIDNNAILGPHPEIGNFIFANGFSGHGLQKSPAVGRGLAELILHGGYRTLDLSEFRYTRILEGQQIIEQNVF
ncbi:NAD(P)/FAD-dependent oxidoreductase [Pseudogemmobacter humi]|uniref:Hydrogen cyanide synthase subunit HcnC n=1 Tax=Pseudogemmobacter humi TaxID=2483812 RepID=A0A3P5XIU3_9RHOB|nr:FAD-binding oxidoreductase [Pseudogemmobacter humi]VDC28662.1 Hydrogen cyanide synthase subunit HcnC precursor [Pseudogemmobacter humi]